MSRSLQAVLGSSLVALALSGCATLEPAYHRPDAPVAATFPQAGATGAAADALPAASLTWQAFFLDPKLSSVVALALDNNRDLRVAIANIEAEQAEYRVQRAALLPTVSASLGAEYGSSSEHQYTTSVGASGYELDFFGRIRSLTKAALETYLATEEARRDTQITIISDVATDYLTLASDEAILQAAKDTVRSGNAALDVTRKRYAHEIAPLSDVREAETVVDEARSDFAADTTTVAQDKIALDLVVGSSVPETLLPVQLDDRVMVMTDLPAGLPSQVLLARPDVLEAEHNLKSANAQIGAARAAFFPTISLTGSGGTTSSSLSSLFKGASGIWSFAPQISVPIFAGGANLANLDYDKAERKVYLAQYEKAIQTAFSDVANALARRATIAEQIADDEADVVASADSLRLSQIRYEQGADTFLNVLTAERTLYSAQQTLDRTRLTRSTNLVTLYTALGGGGLLEPSTNPT